MESNNSIKTVALLFTMTIGIVTGGFLNAALTTGVNANIKPDICGTCDTSPHDPGTFCSFVYPGGGCGSNTGAPCWNNCGI